AGGNNIYNLTVTADDGNGRTTTQDITVTVLPVNDNNPVFTSSATPTVPENTTHVHWMTATDADNPLQTITFAITGGADREMFALNGNTVLTFVFPPDFENPVDVGQNNIYNVTVTANDGNGRTTAQNIAVRVTAANERECCPRPAIVVNTPLDNTD